MKIEAHYMLFRDSADNERYVVFEDYPDNVQICGLVNESKESVYFESDAVHLVGWCHKHNIQYREGKIELEVNPSWNQ